jgi:choloylglycine hydrolase
MCTGIQLTAKTGAVVSARTMEFGIDLESEVMMSPRGHARTGMTPDGLDGLTWKAKYASVGISGLGLDTLIDGVNEMGLVAGIFYFPRAVGYMPYEPADAGKTIAPWQVVSWILDHFGTVKEVQENIGSVVVPAVVLSKWKIVPPFHYVVYDASGKSIVLEYVAGKLNIHENPLGVITNSPAFDWHMTNLNNYLNYSFTNPPPVKLGPVQLTQFGDGSGMFGLPGDITPPSRFVRAAAFSQSVWQSKTGGDAVLQAFHILNNFDIPIGSARAAGSKDGVVEADYTLWTSAKDLETKRYYFRTYESSQIRMVELMKMNLDAKAPVRISMKGDEVIKSVTPTDETFKVGERAA